MYQLEICDNKPFKGKFIFNKKYPILDLFKDGYSEWIIKTIDENKNDVFVDEFFISNIYNNGIKTDESYNYIKEVLSKCQNL